MQKYIDMNRILIEGPSSNKVQPISEKFINLQNLLDSDRNLCSSPIKQNESNLQKTVRNDIIEANNSQEEKSGNHLEIPKASNAQISIQNSQNIIQLDENVDDNEDYESPSSNKDNSNNRKSISSESDSNEIAYAEEESKSLISGNRIDPSVLNNIQRNSKHNIGEEKPVGDIQRSRRSNRVVHKAWDESMQTNLKIPQIEQA